MAILHILDFEIEKGPHFIQLQSDALMVHNEASQNKKFKIHVHSHEQI